MDCLPFQTEITEQELSALGITRYGVITTDQIEFSDEVRKLCADNVCGNYCKTWACPPAIGTVEECKARILAYPYAFVFSSVYQLEDSFDFEGMMEGHAKFKEVCRALILKQLPSSAPTRTTPTAPTAVTGTRATYRIAISAITMSVRWRCAV